MLRVLIVEDDSAISNLIKMTLEAEHYSCTVANDGREGEEYLEKQDWDLVLLDLMLPHVSGYELLEYIRKLGFPVIIISAMNRVDDRIKGLKMGADDYICKPFQIAELVARVESVMRRTSKVMDRFVFGDVTIDIMSRCVYKNGVDVKLTIKEFDLLETLLNNRNIALNRDYLYETVWLDEYEGQTRTLDNHIQRLRKKLGWEDRIQTVFRIGYRLSLPEQ